MTLLQRLMCVLGRSEPLPNYRWQYFEVIRPDGTPEKRPLIVKLLGYEVFREFTVKRFRGRYRLPVAVASTPDCLSIGGDHGYFLVRDTANLQEQTSIRLLPGGDLSVCCDDLDEGPMYFSLECESFKELVEGQYFPDISSQACICDFRQRPPGKFILQLDFPVRHGCRGISYFRWGNLVAGKAMHWVIHRETAFHRILAPPHIVPGQKVTLVVRSLPDDTLPPVHCFQAIADKLGQAAADKRFEDSFEEYVYYDYPVPPDRILRFCADPKCRYLLLADGNKLLGEMISMRAI